ncbi:hypothetical protein GGTG_04561 [Gaeumannomyces tritici R3-111a-1]|uniref:Uncharacterized protein n=1 Tax=Gaeumannomyces tritici (strain R3-111a-1) TaxID=644352 RepID=J3NTG2_GAET3|nr:hypothetical protein GGTG_04561 [Gaeumannomyces tritici R3-111a-1]EJT79477.1 hypothetical protein GGTG_04561 [Gaeumannomyces tritici R3-111a-1]
MFFPDYTEFIKAYYRSGCNPEKKPTWGHIKTELGFLPRPVHAKAFEMEGLNPASQATQVGDPPAQAIMWFNPMRRPLGGSPVPGVSPA